DELMVLLDDGRSTDFRKQPTEPMSWLTTEEPVRVGAAADFTEPVVVAYSFDRWRLNTTTPWESASTDGVDFENTREDAPDEVGGRPPPWPPRAPPGAAAATCAARGAPTTSSARSPRSSTRSSARAPTWWA